MHAEAFSFVRAMTKDRKPKTILELGSRDINGSPRILFPHARGYVPALGARGHLRDFGYFEHRSDLVA